MTPAQLMGHANYLAYVLMGLPTSEARQRYQAIKQDNPVLACLVRSELTRISYNTQHGYKPDDPRYWQVTDAKPLGTS